MYTGIFFSFFVSNEFKESEVFEKETVGVRDDEDFDNLNDSFSSDEPLENKEYEDEIEEDYGDDQKKKSVFNKVSEKIKELFGKFTVICKKGLEKLKESLAEDEEDEDDDSREKSRNSSKLKKRKEVEED